MDTKILTGLVTFLIGVGVGYGLAMAYPTNTLQPRVEYKQVYGTAEIPATWSTVSLGDVAPAVYENFTETGALRPYVTTGKLGYSIAQNNISFGDLNWNQIDMKSADGSDLRRVVQELQSQPDQGGDSWSTETIDNKHADVLTFALDENGEVTKAGTGGKVYFITWDDQGLYMWKQARGNDAFEQGFAHFLATLDLDY